MAKCNTSTYLSGMSLDMSRDYEFTLKKAARLKYLEKHVDNNGEIRVKSNIKSISNKKKIWVVFEMNFWFSPTQSFENINCVQATFKLKHGKYLDNFAVFSLIGNGFSLNIVVDPFIKVYYPFDSLYSLIGLFETKEEAEEYLDQLRIQREGIKNDLMCSPTG